eukprot:363828-Chlamydomonas_euryale.AAC.9
MVLAWCGAGAVRKALRQSETVAVCVLPCSRLLSHGQADAHERGHACIDGRACITGKPTHAWALHRGACTGHLSVHAWAR